MTWHELEVFFSSDSLPRAGHPLCVARRMAGERPGPSQREPLFDSRGLNHTHCQLSLAERGLLHVGGGPKHKQLGPADNPKAVSTSHFCGRDEPCARDLSIGHNERYPAVDLIRFRFPVLPAEPEWGDKAESGRATGP